MVPTIALARFYNQVYVKSETHEALDNKVKNKGDKKQNKKEMFNQIRYTLFYLTVKSLLLVTRPIENL